MHAPAVSISLHHMRTVNLAAARTVIATVIATAAARVMLRAWTAGSRCTGVIGTVGGGSVMHACVWPPPVLGERGWCRM